MSARAFGIDFGTTNSLAAYVEGDRVVSLVDGGTQRPHPSVLWYRGSEIVVGQDARQHLDITEAGAPPGFIRSPKMALRRNGPIFVDGREIDPTDAVAEVFKHLRDDAALPRDRAKGQNVERAVVTIPVDFGGPERKALRQAARKAGIGVIQFVHEPVAALYAYLRSQREFRRELARLEGRSVLVFDWGGGTLDLTLCRIQGGSIMQVASLGDNEVGGDRFDERLRNLLRAKHAAAHSLEDISALEQPGMAAKLLFKCEEAKINLSVPGHDSDSILIRDFLKADGPGRNLASSISQAELEAESKSIIARGLRQIDTILDQARLTHQDIELCLATGGMINMPAIMRGLTERFLGRVPRLPNGDRIIAEGAAWIAHDGLRLTLSKPIELLAADSSGRGSYYTLVPAGTTLPVENQVIPVANPRLFCVDPRQGLAEIEIAKPLRIGTPTQSDPRQTLCVTSVAVDPKAAPLVERLECQLQIDHDYVVSVTLRSTGRGAQTTTEFYDLDFGLSLLSGGGIDEADAEPDGGDDQGQDERTDVKKESRMLGANTGNVAQRTNVALGGSGNHASESHWRLVPGDIVTNWRPNHFDYRSGHASLRQQQERDFYVPCATCKRSISQIGAEGPIDACRGRPCGTAMKSGRASEPRLSS